VRRMKRRTGTITLRSMLVCLEIQKISKRMLESL
jgi:hypothetical protein